MKQGMSIVLLYLVSSVLTVWAMPPRPGISEPASVYEARRLGLIDNPSQGLLQEQMAKGGPAKITGSREYPVVLGYFTDQGSTNTQAEFQAMLFNKSAGTLSTNNYYRDMSYTAMSCSGSVANWVSCGHTVTYIGGGTNGWTSGTTGNVYEFIRDVLTACDGTFNFADSAFDQNHDGIVDVLWVVHSGRGAEETGWANDIWSHSSQLTNWGGGAASFSTNDISPFTGSNVRINRYIIMPERTDASGSGGTTIIGCGVFCHEFGHALGLPDLYDTGNYAITGQGLGNWSTMAGGSWGGNGNSNARPVCLDVWSKNFLGWLDPILIGAPGSYRLRSTIKNSDSSSYKLSEVGMDNAEEYWLIENRYRNARGPYSGVAWDSLLPGQGMGLYHIDAYYAGGTFLSNNRVNVNTSNGVYRNRPYGVAMEETDMTSAGYRSELWTGVNMGEAVDLWSSATQSAFSSTGTSYPISSYNGSDSMSAGSPSYVTLSSISAVGDTMTFSASPFGDFVIGLMQNPAFTQYLVVGVTSNYALLRPAALDTAQMRISGNPTENLGLARIASSRSYHVDYELQVAGTHTIHIAAEDSSNQWHRTDRQFLVVAGKAAGGAIFDTDGAWRLDLAPDALGQDMLLAVIPARMPNGAGLTAISQPIQIGPEGYPLARPSQLALTYSVQALDGKDPERLGIYRLEGGRWRYQEGVLDEAGQQVLAEIDRLGTYLLAWSPSNSMLDKLTTGTIFNVHPNPFAASTEIRYQLSRPGPVRLAVYNAVGQLVRVIAEGNQSAGLHRAVWDGRDGQGRASASGVYLFRILSGTTATTGRMVKVK